MAQNVQRLRDRFLRYVKVETTANPDATDYPSSEGQRELGRMLLGELQELGLTDARQDEFALVTATIPGNQSSTSPTIAFNAHMDTSADASGKNVNPQVIENYDGSDVVLSEDLTISGSDPELQAAKGCTIITTDGSTLLGGDDKAGVAIIMELATYLVEHPDIPHGDIRLLFTCDEEIGRGVDHVDVSALGADVCYTLDGPGENFIDVETFSADEATVTIRGVNIHPAIAKGRMINAVRIAGTFLDRLPRQTLAPEVTDGRSGFLHPYRIVEGQVDRVVIKVLLRDFDTCQLTEYAELLRSVAAEVVAEYPGSAVDVDVRQQYRNLGEGLKQEPRAVSFAEEAFHRLGRQAQQEIIRGGTDGSRLTELGLPTPNLSSGQHNIHSPLEWACLDEMVAATEMLVELVQVWAAAESS